MGMAGKYLLHHAVHGFQQERPFLRCAGRKFAEQLLRLLFYLRHFRIKQNVG